MVVVKPGNDNLYYSKNNVKIFLAGSIEMGAAEEWQKVIEDTFRHKSELVIFNPRRDDWDSSWEQKESNGQFNYQVNWELDRLTESDIIFMYFAPDTKSPISLLELGLYAGSKKMIVVCPDSFWRKGNVDIVCNRYDIPIYETLDKGIGALRTRLKDVR
jgi:hypothetical protein